MLSGEQLVNLHSKTNHELPTSGPKEFQPTKSWLEQKQIQSSLDERKTLLEEERVEKWSNLMLAEWNPEKGKAVVTRINKSWEVFGHHSEDCDWLFPEEVLYLLEMNSVECMYGGVPLSIERGYSLMLGPGTGCSFNEYRVFAHLSRAGYRVTRHLPELTVTAYERQIRLDQHIEQRQTYTTDPKLPPKTFVQLSPGKEVLFEIGSGVDLVKTEQESGKNALPVTTEVNMQKEIEVIDLLDSSSSSSSSEEDESDSDIEVIHDSGPVLKMETVENSSESEEEDEDDDDIEIIEVPFPQKNIVVATINSSDSEHESDRSYDGNFKRSTVTTNKHKFVRPDSIKLNFFKCLSVEEFCRDNPLSEGENKEGSTSNGEFLGLEQSSNKRVRSTFCVTKNRRDILDLMPTMAGKTKKLMSLEVPDLNLIPDTISPRQDLYTFNTNALRARLFSTFRGRFRGRGFRGSFPSSPWSSNSYQNNNSSVMFPNESVPLFQQAQALHNILSRGPNNLIQAASLLVQLSQETGTGIGPGNMPLMPNIPQPGYTDFDYPQNRVMPFQNHGPSNRGRMMLEDNRFPYANFRSSPAYHGIESESENHFDTTNPYPFHRDVPCESRRPFGRRRGRFGRNLQSRGQTFIKTENTSFPADPAYSRPDVPLGTKNTLSNRTSLVPNASSNQAPVVIDLSNSDSTAPIQATKIMNKNMNRKRRKQMKKTLYKAKRLCNSMPPEVIFLDSPNSTENMTSSVTIKSENASEPNTTIKQENESIVLNQPNISLPIIKTEIKAENVNSTSMEDKTKENVPITIKKEHVPEENLRVDVKIERQNETSSMISETASNDTSISSASVKEEPVVDSLGNEKPLAQEATPDMVNEDALSEVNVSLAQKPDGEYNSDSVEAQAEKDINNETAIPSIENNSMDLALTMNVKHTSKPSDDSTQTQSVIKPGLEEQLVTELSVREELNKTKQDDLTTENKRPEVTCSSEFTSITSMDVDDQSNTMKESPEKVQVEEEINKKSNETSSSFVSTSSDKLNMPGIESNSMDLAETINVESVSKCSNDNTQTESTKFGFEEKLVTEISVRQESNKSKQDEFCTENRQEIVSSSELSMDVDDSSNTLDENSGKGVSEVTENKTPNCTEMEVDSINDIGQNAESSIQNKENNGDFATSKENVSFIGKDSGSSDVGTDKVSEKVDSVSENATQIADLLNEEHLDKIKSSSKPLVETKENAPENPREKGDLAESSEKSREVQTNTVISSGVEGDDSFGLTKEGPKSSTKNNDDSIASTSEERSRVQNNKEVSSWGYIKKHNVTLTSGNNVENETTSNLEQEEEETDEIRPLIKPRHCKTIGSVLSALQIFSPITVKVPEESPKLKISFDMYKALDFRKSQRGLPHYRIAVFCGSDPLPSPCQLQELQQRFADGVPVLRAVVTPQSVLFYTSSDICLPVDDTSYKT